MNMQRNRTDFRVTQTQKLIAAKALGAVTQQEVHPDDPRITDFARAMVIIQNGRKGAYFSQGTSWSLASRAQREPVQVAQERFDLASKTDDFEQAMGTATGEAARRIRGNRARRIRAEIREIEEMIVEREQGFEERFEDEFEEMIEFDAHNRLRQLREELESLRLEQINARLQQAA